MCGIFGAIILPTSSLYSHSRKIAGELFTESERRGKEASGVIRVDARTISYTKFPGPSAELKKSRQFLLDASLSELESFTFVGHTRLATNGSLHDNLNNQPICVGGTLAVHNGIIVNDMEMWKNISGMQAKSKVDTEALVASVELLRKKYSIVESLQKTFQQIYGTASVALLFDDVDEVMLATNNGSLYVYHDLEDGVFLFASEYRILHAVIKKYISRPKSQMFQISAGSGLAVSLSTTVIQRFSLMDVSTIVLESRLRTIQDHSSYVSILPKQPASHHRVDQEIMQMYEEARQSISHIRRCARCILPATFPGITFNDQGVCDICSTYTPLVIPKDGAAELKSILKKHARTHVGDIVQADLVMGFSGGRDSCYGLHYLVRELGLRPIVYTYDWGVITDLGRRNQARLCAKLGIEHVIVSADIQKKRSHIRKNLLAWMKKPDLGMVPLFMAGDKQYFSHLNLLAHDLQMSNVMLCENPLERTLFKYRFANMQYSDLSTTTYQTSWMQKSEILRYYGTQFLGNPAYLNSSLVDTFSGFLSYFVHSNSATYHQLFSYIPWNEEVIDSTLIDEYEWEFAEDTQTSWRIGDGTAPWYNLIYYVIAGFSEHETFRSNQIREGVITRDEALRLSERDNIPRLPSLRWYFDTMDVDLGAAVRALRGIQRRYTKQG